MSNQRGFTLIEVLVSLSILGVIITALFQTIGSTTALSNSTNSSNDLIREGQIAQQVLNARIKEACYIYPTDNTITLATSGLTTKNAFSAPPSYDWKINTHPMIAMILPPDSADLTLTNYRFFAYYAIPRSQYISQYTAGVASAANPGADSINDSTVWMLMEYRNPIDVSSDIDFPSKRCADLAGNSKFVYKGLAGNILTDYILPVSPSTGFLSVGGTGPAGGASYIEYNLRFQQTTRAGNVISVGGGASGTTLSAKVYPANLGL